MLHTAEQYAQLLEPVDSEVTEKANGYQFITERHLQALWFEQKYFFSLKTSLNESIEVISPGIWNTEAGPDFLKAHIKINGIDYRGDIEIHLSDEGWVQHGHHLDPRYESVVLHISLWYSSKLKPLIRRNGEEIRRTYLEPVLTVPVTSLSHLIDLDLYPYRKFIGSGKCSLGLFNDLPEESVEYFFISASYWRLLQKRKWLSERFADETLQFGAALALALGYKHNADSFLALYTFLLRHQEKSEETLFSLGLGCAGFFDSHAKDHWFQSDYFLFLKKIWEEESSQVDLRISLRMDRIRPLNHPVRRIGYLVRWIKRMNTDRVIEQLFQIWETRPVLDRKGVNELKNAFKSTLPSYDDIYWNRHYTFETTALQSQLSIIGKDVREAILINGFFPLLAFRMRENQNRDELDDFQKLYGSFTSQYPRKTLYLIHRFFGDGPKQTVFKRAQIEQGAYQLHKDFCTHFEASCEGCPFLDRFKKVF